MKELSHKDIEAIKALMDYDILDTEDEIIYDNITKLASEICGTKIALISFLDENRQWFKSRVGLDAKETPREISFCQYSVRQEELFIVEDTFLDNRFTQNPLVQGFPFIRFYAGAPLKTPEGKQVGTICVIDEKPMALTEPQKEALRTLSQMVVAQLELRKKTKELLKQKSILKQTEDLIDAVPDLIGTCSLDGIILSHNEAFERISKVQGRDHIFSYYPKWVKIMMEDISIPHAIEHSMWRGESAILTKNGNEIQVFQTVLCHRDEFGYPKYFSTIIQDISVIKATTSKFESLTKLAPVGIFMTDELGNTTFVNEFWLKLSGMDHSEALRNGGRGAFDCLHPEESSDVLLNWREAVSKKSSFFMEHRIGNRQGNKYHDVQTRTTPLLNNQGEVIGHIGICTDITAQNESQRKLKSSVRQLRSYIENLPAAVALFDKDIRYITVSKKWIKDYHLDKLGHDEKNIIGKSHYEVFPDQSTEWKSDHQYALKGNAKKKDDDSFLREDGTVEWLNWEIRPWFDDDNTIGGIMMLTEVTTVKKKVELDLIRARSDAEKASRAKSVFIKNMSHEIRTPLNSIIGLSEILSKELAGSVQAQHIKVVQKSGEVLLALMNDVLDISSIETGKIGLKEDEVNLQELTEKILQIFSFEAGQKNIILKHEVDPTLGTFLGDSVRITQILIKLMGNAIKYTPEGEVTIKVFRNPSLKPTGNVIISVEDNGIGIDCDKQALIFEKFTQIESSDVRNYGGTGLGLALTKNLVQMMNGEIWVTSSKGAGSCFSFSLDLKPLTKKNAQPIGEDQALELYDQNLKILLVDDSLENRNLIMAYLKKFPFEVTMAENGEEALQHLKHTKFDLVFMDVQMPVMDGLTATKVFREWEKINGTPRVPIAALTAFALEEDMTRSLDAGCDIHITKPVKKFTILDTIKVLITKSA
jgi:PAS domain S-box-containing protein